MGSKAAGLVEFDEPRHGFHGLLLEAKSGAQDYRAAVYQLKCYRAALRDRIPGPMIVWGIVEREEGHDWKAEVERLPRSGGEDLWVFSPAAGITDVVERLQLCIPR